MLAIPLQVQTLAAARSDEGRAVAEVTQLATDSMGEQLAVGHADGTVRIWNLSTGDCLVTFSGHKVLPYLSPTSRHNFCLPNAALLHRLIGLCLSLLLWSQHDKVDVIQVP